MGFNSSMAWFGHAPNPDGPHLIYLTTSPSGKVYVGLTKGTLPGRKSGHLGAARLYADKGNPDNHHFYNAIAEYGADAFLWGSLESDIDGRVEANRRERIHVARLQANDPRYGYNGTEGGDAGALPNETERERIRLAAKIRVARGITPRQLETLREGRKLKPRPSASHMKMLWERNTGSKAAPETRLRMLVASKGVAKSTAHRKAIQLAEAHPVLRSDGKPFLSRAEASRQMGARTDLWKSLRGHGGICGGFRFKAISITEYTVALDTWGPLIAAGHIEQLPVWTSIDIRGLT